MKRERERGEGGEEREGERERGRDEEREREREREIDTISYNLCLIVLIQTCFFIQLTLPSRCIQIAGTCKTNLT